MPNFDERFESFLRWAQAEGEAQDRLTYAVLAVADRLDALVQMFGALEPSAPDVERLCEVMHDAYEAAAAREGWATQERSRKPWAEVPEENKATMRAAVSALLQELR